MSERWIVIPRWFGRDGFQHYRKRDPKWIKTYARLHHNHDYMNLTGHQRAVLHDLRLMFASHDGHLPLSTSSLSRQLQLRVMTRDLESLNHAGFIELVDSKPLALSKQVAALETETEKETPKSPSGKAKPEAKPEPVQERKPKLFPCRYCSSEFKSTRVRGEHEDRHRMYDDVPHTPIEEVVA